MKYFKSFLLLLISVNSFGQKGLPEGVFKKDVIVDAELSEWGEKLQYFDKENQLWYSVSNDKDFLYLAIFKEKHASKVLSPDGIQLYISNDKISDKSLSVIYPIHQNSESTIKTDGGSFNGFFPKLTWDLLVVKNLEASKQDTVSVFNDFGIQAQGQLIKNEEWEKKMQEMQEKAGRSRGASVMSISVIGGAINVAPRVNTDDVLYAKRMAVHVEFAIPLKHLKSDSGALNIKIVLKGDSDSASAASFTGIQQGYPEGAMKDEALDALTATEYSFVYKVVNK